MSWHKPGEISCSHFSTHYFYHTCRCKEIYLSGMVFALSTCKVAVFQVCFKLTLSCTDDILSNMRSKVGFSRSVKVWWPWSHDCQEVSHSRSPQCSHFLPHQSCFHLEPLSPLQCYIFPSRLPSAIFPLDWVCRQEKKQGNLLLSHFRHTIYFLCTTHEK